MPMPKRLRAAVALSLLSIAALPATPRAALASCVIAPPLEQAVEAAEIVFIGTVEETAQGNRWASVAVEEVWRGPDQPKTVVVKGGPAGNTATSVDRSFEVGVKYIFLPYVDPAEGLSDNSCTNTQPWTEAMAALRPAGARPPIGETNAPADGGVDLGGFVGPAILVAVVFAVLLGIGLLAQGRQDA
jgi:hypothetical protein